MRRLLLTAAIVACLVAAAVPVRADEMVDAVRVPTPVAIALPPVDRPAPRRSPVRPIMYGLQALDSIFTAAALRRAHRYEANPTMGPFSHGGIPTLALGFALGDLARARLFRHSATAADGADMLQAASNVDGIRTTLRSLHAP